MWKSPVYFHTLFIPGEGVIVHLYWATMYAWSNALDKYVKNFDFIVMLWESCTRHCSYYSFDRGTGAQEMSKGLSAHYSEILEYSCVMCEPVVYRTTGSHWQASAASMLSCLLTSCGFLSRVNFIIGRIGHWKGFSLNAVLTQRNEAVLEHTERALRIKLVVLALKSWGRKAISLAKR